MKRNSLIMKIIFLALFINLLVYILYGSKALLNSDSAFFVDFSIEQLETGKVFPITWINTNDFWVYSLIPFITPFIKFGLGIYISRQLSVLIQTFFFISVIYYFYKYIMNDKKGLKIFLLKCLQMLLMEQLFLLCF